MSFIFKITTTTSPQTFVIPCVNDGTFNATVDYGDGTGSQTVTAYNDSNLTHSFATAGQHTITIDGTFPNIRFYNDAASAALVDEVGDLGDVGWVNLGRAFRDCTNLTAFNVGTADTSNVTTMYQMFYICTNLTSLDLSGFDTSSVTDMSFMFRDCSSLTALDVSNFDTSSVTDMSFMFFGCSSLTTLDVSSFDTSSVNNMQQMFRACSSLTSLDLSTFNISNVSNMGLMFRDCSNLTALDVSNFDTSSVTNMLEMFRGCSSLTSLDLSGFDTSSVNNMYTMFYNCNSLTSLDVSSFDTSSVTGMGYMFENCTSLTNLNIKHFDISSVTNGVNFLLNANNALTTTQYDELLEAWAAQDVQPNVTWHFGNAQYTAEVLAHWYSARGVSSLSIINNKLVSIADSTLIFGAAQQVDNLIIGNVYTIACTATCSNSSAEVYIRASTNSNLAGTNAFQDFNANATGTVTANSTFTATATTLSVGVIVNNHAANDTVTIDSGMTSRLIEEDRSINSSNLQVFGTITKDPVATGAELVAYSGFSASNYLKADDAIIPRGDSSWSWWSKDSEGDRQQFYIGDPTTQGPEADGSGLTVWAYSGMKIRFCGKSQNLTTSNSNIISGAWNHYCITSDNNRVYIYVNGVFAKGFSSDRDAFTNTGFYIGTGHYANSGSDGMALFKVSANAVTTSQVEKMYLDEKELFKENAACTLYGTNDTVSSLAYNEDTDLLYAGTSAGTSVFKGLQRVSNTVASVGSSISASNNLVVEE